MTLRATIATALVTFSLGCTNGAEEPATTAGEGLPCDVNEVLSERCRSCHAAEPRFGAPMPLTSWQELQAPAPSDPDRTVWELVGERIHDEERPMPPEGLLPETERAPLDGWLADAAPRASDADSCNTGEPAMPRPAEELPCEPDHALSAHGETPEQPHHVEPEADNAYRCFVFPAPFEEDEQLTAYRPLIDDERVVHHWILYATDEEVEQAPDFDCDVKPFDVVMLMGWAPGGVGSVMPQNVGMELPDPGGTLILEMHYWNAAGHEDVFDRTGVEMCTTDEPREHTAGVVTLGSIDIDIPPRSRGHEVTGRCSNAAREGPITIMSAAPHMHLTGRSLVTEILRGGGAGETEELVRVDDWDFDNQGFEAMPEPVVLQPGDAMRTTCVYDNPTDQPIRFGERTEDEMCFNFLSVYPVPDIPFPARACIF